MECFTADFLRVLSESVKIWPLGVRLGTRHQCQAFKDFLEISYIPKILSLKLLGNS